MESKDKNEAYKKLRKFILAAQASELEEFNATLNNYIHWAKYILNSFDCSYSEWVYGKEQTIRLK